MEALKIMENVALIEFDLVRNVRQAKMHYIKSGLHNICPRSSFDLPFLQQNYLYVDIEKKHIQNVVSLVIVTILYGVHKNAWIFYNIGECQQ